MKVRYCRVCKREITGSKQGNIYCQECSTKMKHFRKNVCTRNRNADVLPETAFVSVNDAYTNLAGAIVRAAFEDYKYLLDIHIKHPEDPFYSKQLLYLNTDIHTDYFNLLCLGLDLEWVIHNINNLYKE